ncbi:MAG: hypothetical protein WC376_03580 [Candidatus Nanoarchaeia archaeon]|jgi:hypothetical protein
MNKVSVKEYFSLKKEYGSLKKRYYSMKAKVIANISKEYCIIPEDVLINLRKDYEAKFLELLKYNEESVAKELVRDKFDLIAQEYYVNISKEYTAHSAKEVEDLEKVLSFYEASFDNSAVKEGLLKLVGKTPSSKIITGIQILTAALCFFDSGNIPKNLLEILLMQYSKYQVDKHLYKKKTEDVAVDKKMLALREGIDYLDKYFERKGIKILD